MHDRHGRQVEHGDVVLAKTWWGTQELVKVVGGVPQSDTCNLYCKSFDHVGNHLMLTAKETTLVCKANGCLVAPPSENVCADEPAAATAEPKGE